MGNDCCNSPSEQKAELLQSTSPIEPKDKKPSYIDSEGNPLPNAYRRFVKPPTTVGRQSVIVRNLRENDEIPEWIWAQDAGLLNSDANKNYFQNNAFSPLPQNRNTFQQIKGHYKGVQTINMSKLGGQNKMMIGSEIVAPNQAQNNSPFRHTVQPNITQSYNPTIAIRTSAQEPQLNLKRTNSISNVPVINSISPGQPLQQYNEPQSPRLLSQQGPIVPPPVGYPMMQKNMSQQSNSAPGNYPPYQNIKSSNMQQIPSGPSIMASGVVNNSIKQSYTSIRQN